jgi:hypothetical protein
MGQIQERKRKDGTTGFTAQVRRKKNGKTILNLTETFNRRSQAEAWLKRKERELSKPGALVAAVKKQRARTLREVIKTYIGAKQGEIGRSKLQNLNATCRFDFADRDAESLTADDFVQFASELLEGVQPAPVDPEAAPADYYELKPRLPQTVHGYMSHLGVVIRHGGPLVSLKLPKAEFLEAMESCRHLGITGSSDKRDRRPTLDELNKLMKFFYDFSQRDPRSSDA